MRLTGRRSREEVRRQAGDKAVRGGVYNTGGPPGQTRERPQTWEDCGTVSSGGEAAIHIVPTAFDVCGRWGEKNMEDRELVATGNTTPSSLQSRWEAEGAVTFSGVSSV